MQFRKTIGSVSIRQKAAAKSCLFLLAFVVAALLATSSIQAQQYLGTLSGSVSDATGAKVVGANVTATDVTTNFETKAVTNGSGEYTIPFLTPDTYKVTVASQGFRAETRTGVVLTAGGNVAADFTLNPGSETQSVVVTADTQLLDTTSGNLATTFLTEEVTDTPNVGRNPFVLSTLAAGIYSALWQYLWVERPVQDSAPWKSPRAGVSPTRLRGQFEAQLSEQNMEAAARQHFA